MCSIYNENTDTDKTNMDFLNDLTQLEELILYADYGHLELSNTENLSVKKVTLYTDGGKEEFEEILAKAFPNAEIEVIVR